MKTCACPRWVVPCSIPIASPSSKAARKVPTGAPTSPSRCRSTTAPSCCCSKPSSNFKDSRFRIGRWMWSRSATSMKVCWSVPSSAPSRSRWNSTAPRAPSRLGGLWPNSNPHGWTVQDAWPNCSNSVPAVPPAACATTWLVPWTMRSPIACWPPATVTPPYATASSRSAIWCAPTRGATRWSIPPGPSSSPPAPTGARPAPITRPSPSPTPSSPTAPPGPARRETGTHYTPKSLTEAIVTETLTPIAYVGPAQGTPRADWALKSPAELLDLKICDPAMGSGAFLVQACRWLADRLVEAWAQAEARGHMVGVGGCVGEADANVEALPCDIEARTIVARRLIAERCLYGVDLNPLAVELAKLSIWLVTLAKGRPFGFLDHNLRCGDSLLGIHRLDQLTQLSMNPTGQGQLRLFGQNIERAVREAIELRQRLREMPIRDIHDVEMMAHLDADARRRLEVPESIADAFIGEVFASGGSGTGLERTLTSLTVQAGQ